VKRIDPRTGEVVEIISADVIQKADWLFHLSFTRSFFNVWSLMTRARGPIIANAAESGIPVPGSRAFLERARQNVRKGRCIPCADEKALDFQKWFLVRALLLCEQRQDADLFQELFGGHLTPVKAED
jgi:hypothetical protein